MNSQRLKSKINPFAMVDETYSSLDHYLVEAFEWLGRSRKIFRRHETAPFRDDNKDVDISVNSIDTIYIGWQQAILDELTQYMT
jgi:hypothetical protein